MITILCQMSSLSQIKRSRQEETNREQRRGGKKDGERKAQQSDAEGENKESVCVIKRTEKKKQF